MILQKFQQHTSRKIMMNFNRASEMAKLSNMGTHLGCVITSGGKIISEGYNNSLRNKVGNYVGPSTHAEMSTILRLQAKLCFLPKHREKESP